MTTAQTIIGSHDTQDWTIQPTQPPSDLETKAPALWNRLHEQRVRGPARRYEQANEAAGAAQQRFKGQARNANLAVLVATALGAVITAVGVLDKGPNGGGSTIVMICGVLGGLVGALGAMWLGRIKEGELLAEWMTNRAQAETARIEYFDKVTVVRPGDDPTLASLQLEYFRRYQLEVQLAYYRGRGMKHQEAARATVASRMWAVFIASGANGLAGLLSTKQVNFSALASVGVIATGCGAYLTTAGATNQDGRNAERYARTHDTLSHLQDRLDEVRDALGAGQLDALPAFVKAVNDEISLEHRQWLDERNRYAGAIQELEQKLVSLQRDREARAASIGPQP
jgi:hypothetical protein